MSSHSLKRSPGSETGGTTPTKKAKFDHPEEFDCILKHHLIENPVLVTCCGASACETCFQQAQKKNESCTNCAAPIKNSIPNLSLRIAVEKFRSRQANTFAEEPEEQALVTLEDFTKEANKAKQILKSGKKAEAKKLYLHIFQESNAVLEPGTEFNNLLLLCCQQLADFEKEEGNIYGAVEFLDEVLKLDINNKGALFNKATMLKNVGHFAEAKETVKRLLFLEPTHKKAGELFLSVRKTLATNAIIEEEKHEAMFGESVNFS